MIAVVLLHENGQRQEVLLAGAPRVGERIRLPNGVDEPPYIVKGVLWMPPEAPDPDPQVIVSIRREDLR